MSCFDVGFGLQVLLGLAGVAAVSWAAYIFARLENNIDNIRDALQDIARGLEQDRQKEATRERWDLPTRRDVVFQYPLENLEK